MTPAVMRPGEQVGVRKMRYVVRIGQVWRRDSDAALIRLEHVYRADKCVRGHLLLLKDGSHIDPDVTAQVSFRELSTKWRLIDDPNR